MGQAKRVCLGAVYGFYRQMAVLAGEEDGTLILVSWFLGMGEGGTVEGLVEFSTQALSSGLHGHLPSQM